MTSLKQIASTLTLATAFGGNAYACGSAPSPSDSTAPTPVEVSIYDNKLHLSQGIWSVAADKNDTYNVTSSMKCIMAPEVYKAADAQMTKLVSDVCGSTVNVRATIAEGSRPPTDAHIKQFCQGYNNNLQTVKLAP